MEKQLKSVLKKMDNKGSNRKVHFSPQKARTETNSEQRKRPLAHESARKKLKVCQTVSDLHKAEELIIGTENQLRYIESKLQDTSLAYSAQYLNVSEIMCNVVALDNRINVFVDDLSHAERQIERCADELDMIELDNLLASAQEADRQYNDFISSLEQAIKLLNEDKVDMLSDQAVIIERQLQKLILV